MERKRILIAVKTSNDIQQLRSSLITTGYEVTVANDGVTALGQAQEFHPHLVFCEIELPKIDGHHLFQELRSQSTTRKIPFVLMSHHRSVEERVHSMNLGVDEYITTPFDVKEVIVRFEIILREIERYASISRDRSKGFWGNLHEMNLVELLQTLEIGANSGVAKVHNDRDAEGLVVFSKGEVLDASLQELGAEKALFRMFSWSSGTFHVEMRPIDQVKVIDSSTSDLINRGFIYRDRWEQSAQALPPLYSRVHPSHGIEAESLSNREKSLLRLIQEGARIDEVIEHSRMDDLECLQLVTVMFRRGLLVARDPHEGENGKKAAQTNGQYANPGELQLSELFDNFLRPKSQAAGGRVERRREERRRADRRLRDRRRSEIAERPHSYFTRTELILIREKLSNRKTMQRPKTLSGRAR